MSEKPLIYTVKGNLPVEDLRYHHEWQEDDSAITLVEEYYLGDELVRRNVHARLKKGLPFLLKQQTFGE